MSHTGPVTHTGPATHTVAATHARPFLKPILGHIAYKTYQRSATHTRAATHDGAATHSGPATRTRNYSQKNKLNRAASIRKANVFSAHGFQKRLLRYKYQVELPQTQPAHNSKLYIRVEREIATYEKEDERGTVAASVVKIGKEVTEYEEKRRISSWSQHCLLSCCQE